MNTISDIAQYLEHVCPPLLQESYDNCGLLLGNPHEQVKGVLCCLDVTMEVIEEAIAKGCNMLVAHHPLIFGSLKKITGKNYMEQIILFCIKHDIAVYAIHTNLDNMHIGVNGVIAGKLGLNNIKVLESKPAVMRKLACFCPTEQAEEVRNAMFDAGAGQWGNYDRCSFNTSGNGTFRANEHANPYVGQINEVHVEEEIKIECVFPFFRENAIVQAMLRTHPYETVAYDIITIQNKTHEYGSGLIGELPKPVKAHELLETVKKLFGCEVIKHSRLQGALVQNIAVCGGSGAFLIGAAKSLKADMFITADLKYHDFFEATNQFILADIGHYESEQFTSCLIFDLLMKKINKFAVHISEINTNPIQYFK